MTMPREILLIRHEESEANVVQKNIDGLATLELTNLVNQRPDSLHPLTPRGIRRAKMLGGWIREHIGPLAEYDMHYVSPYVRTTETAAYISGDEDVVWYDMRWIVERDWGDYGRATREEQQEKYGRTFEHKKIDPVFATFDGGESNLDVMVRMRLAYDTLHRQHTNDRVVMVTHGGVMNVVINDLERLWVDEWRWREVNDKYDLPNGAIVRLSRVHPDDLERGTKDAPEHPTIRWKQVIYPLDPENSPHGGEWVELSPRRGRTAAEMIQSVKNVERFLKNGERL